MPDALTTRRTPSRRWGRSASLVSPAASTGRGWRPLVRVQPFGQGTPWRRIHSASADGCAPDIRILLVPATMRLLVRWNWWFPGRPALKPGISSPQPE